MDNTLVVFEPFKVDAVAFILDFHRYVFHDYYVLNPTEQSIKLAQIGIDVNYGEPVVRLVISNEDERDWTYSYPEQVKEQLIDLHGSSAYTSAPEYFPLRLLTEVREGKTFNLGVFSGIRASQMTALGDTELTFERVIWHMSE